MAESGPFLHPSKPSTPELGAPPPQTKQAAPRFLSNFLYKVIFFVVFIILLPLFPSQPPESANQSILTRSWELIHLLLVGIAISYGLFSRRNADPDVEKENPWKADSPQSYVSHILHVSSVFDEDEVDSPHGSLDEGKVQTWSSQYYRNEPVVVVAKGGTNGGKTTNKPLFLPVRSLKSRVRDSEGFDSFEENNGRTGSFNRFRESRSFNSLSPRYDSNESVVFPSLVSRRSRSGRNMEENDESISGPGTSPPPYPLPSSVLDADTGPSESPSFCSTISGNVDVDMGPSKTPSFRYKVSGGSNADANMVLSRTPSFRSTVTHNAATTPSPKRLSSSPSPSSEVRAKSCEDSVKKKSFYKSVPPPAPPPPPPFLLHGYSPVSDKKVVTKSFKDELKDMSRRGREEWQGYNNPSSDDWRPPTRVRSNTEGSSVGRSVRTVRPKEVPRPMPENSSEDPLGYEAYEAHQPPPVPRYPTDVNNGFIEKVIISPDVSDSEEDVSESSEKEDAANSTAETGPDENEVDKKADEFIAKFREQIRLQRIESIKRSTGHRRVRNPK